MSSERLEQGIALSRAGKQVEAGELFAQLVAADVHDEMAWLWYASTLTTRKEMAKALEECLYHNPQCAEAQERLAIVQVRQPAAIQGTVDAARMEGALITETNRCPFCAEVVAAEAMRCPHCGQDKSAAHGPSNRSPQDEPADVATSPPATAALPAKTAGGPTRKVVGLIAFAIIGLCTVCFGWNFCSTFLGPSDALQRAEAPVRLPAHRVNDMHGPPSVFLFIVVAKDFPESDTWILIDHYQEQYRHADVFNIHFLCDDTYAWDHMDYVHDDVYFPHVLYTYMRTSTRTTFSSPRNPDVEGQGSACR